MECKTTNIFIPAGEGMRNIFQNFLFMEQQFTFEKYAVTDNKDDAEYLACNIFYVDKLLEEMKDDDLSVYKKIVLFDLFHAWDGMNEYGRLRADDILSVCPEANIILLTQNLKCDNSPEQPEQLRIVNYSAMFNFCKLYYSDVILDHVKFFHYSDRKNYYDIPIKEICNATRTKKFMCMNKTYTEGRPYRWKLDKMMVNKPDGYYGNPDRGLFIDSNVEAETKHFSPPATKYFKDVFLNIFCETCSIENLNFSPTEKTFVPIMMGLFIVPFANMHYIHYLSEMGFRFPTFINYSYDGIEDPDERWEAYSEEVERLLTLSVEQLERFYFDNIDIIVHNKKHLKRKSFYSLLDIFC